MTRFRVYLIPILLMLFVFPSVAQARSKSFLSGNVECAPLMTYEDFRQVDGGYTFLLRNGTTAMKTEFYILVNGKDFFGKTVYYKRLYINFLSGNEKKPIFIGGPNEDIYQFSLKYEDVSDRDVRIISD